MKLIRAVSILVVATWSFPSWVHAQAGSVFPVPEEASVVEAAVSEPSSGDEFKALDLVLDDRVDVEERSLALRPSCDVAGIDTSGGSFVIATRRGLPASPEALLSQFDLADDTPPSSRSTATDVEGNGLVAQLRSARVQQATGDYAASAQTLEEILAAGASAAGPNELAATHESLGNAYLALGRNEEAQQTLSRGIAIAEDTGNPGLAAQIWNDLGNSNAADADPRSALQAYARAAALAAQSNRGDVEIRALANAARVALELEDLDECLRLLETASARIENRPASVGRTRSSIHLSLTWTRLAARGGTYREAAVLEAYELLDQARRDAIEQAETNLLTYALGNLGALYLQEGHLDEALVLSRRAIRTGREGAALDGVYRWYWQEGRILWQQGQAAEAIQSYRQAVDILEETRQFALARYGSAELEFRERVAPVYLSLADALIRTADTSIEDAAQENLRAARSTMEGLRTAELRNYLQSDCLVELASKRVDVDRVVGDAVVVYPISFPDRLDLLITRNGRVEHHVSPVTREDLDREVIRFRRALMSPASRDYETHAKQLYQWIIAPYAERLEGVTTLVFVPGGLLRTIPMAALHDGKQFVLERFATAITPSLGLIDPRPLELENLRMLAAGISESVRGHSALAKVPDELRGVVSMVSGEILLDSQFTVDRFEQEIVAKRPNVVHVASHGVFTGKPQTSFLLAHDRELSMPSLAEIIGQARFQRDPLELLVLSACETASGDERAGLGLAGVAIRAGARSAMGSLWNIADEAAYRLVLDFYRELGMPGVSRAEALRRAQLALFASERFSHPFYWSPFLMINDWL